MASYRMVVYICTYCSSVISGRNAEAESFKYFGKQFSEQNCVLPSKQWKISVSSNRYLFVEGNCYKSKVDMLQQCRSKNAAVDRREALGSQTDFSTKAFPVIRSLSLFSLTGRCVFSYQAFVFCMNSLLTFSKADTVSSGIEASSGIGV